MKALGPVTKAVVYGWPLAMFATSLHDDGPVSAVVASVVVGGYGLAGLWLLTRSEGRQSYRDELQAQAEFWRKLSRRDNAA